MGWHEANTSWTKALEFGLWHAQIGSEQDSRWHGRGKSQFQIWNSKCGS